MTNIGELRTEGDVQIDGHLCGNFNCAQLVVGKDADITGAIVAKEVVVRGKITGTIRATRILLEHTACVESDIVYKLLSIDEGARFEGVARCRPNPLQDDAAVSAMTELQQINSMNGATDGSKNQAAYKTGIVSLLGPETLNPR